MPIDIRIQIDLSSHQKRVIRSAVVAGAVIGALGLGVAIAMPKNKFNPGDPLSSQKMNENFIDLDARLASLEKLRIGTIKATAGPSTGLITAPGGLTGLPAARAICQTALNNSPTAHMCDASEMVRSMQLGIPIPGGVQTAWIASGARGDFTNDVRDCQGYTNGSGTTGGATWAGLFPDQATCSLFFPIACCD